MTGTQVVTRCLMKLGVVGPGIDLSNDDATDALEVINALIDQWAAESLTVHTLLRTVKALTNGTRDYTIGLGGSIDIVRPVSIEYATMILDSTATDPIETLIDVYTDQEWASIRQKTLDSGTLDGIFYDRAFSSTARGTISTYPTINIANVQIVLYTPLAITKFTALATDLVFPPAYEKALVDTGAFELAPYFSKARTPDVVADAIASKAAFKRVNIRPVSLSLPAGLPGIAGRYDIEIDSTR